MANNNNTSNKWTRVRLGLEVGRGPLFILFGELPLHPRDGDGGPYTSPEEGKDPADLGTVSTGLGDVETKVHTT